MAVTCPSPTCRANIAQTPTPARCPVCSSPLRGAEPKLVIRMPGGLATEFPIRDRLSMGRNPQRNNICISDREVSKEHAVVERRGSEVIVRDLGSSNGTFVNEAKIGEHRLKDGDIIRVGTTQIVYMAAEAQPAITIGNAPSGSNPLRQAMASPTSQQRANLTVVHSFNAPVLAQVKSSTERNLKAVTDFEDMEQLREEYRRLQVALEFQEGITIDKGVDALLEQILTFAHTTLKADNGAILKRAEKGFEASHIKQRNPNAAGFTVSDTLLEQVATTRSALLIQDVDVDPRFSAAQSIVSQGIKCAMGVPLITKGNVRAVLYLDILQRTHSFTDTDLKLLNAIAIQAAYTLENAELVAQVEQEAAKRANLARFLSPALVEEAQGGDLDLHTSGKSTDITVLFSDIRGFTTMSEKETPENVVAMLNEYFEIMVEIVFKYGGTLDKFIGDSIMALWGTPKKRPDDAENAVRAALEMQQRMVPFNRGRVAAGKAAIYMGVGINSGQAVVGSMGSSRRSDYTAIGDAVNLASRLCHEARANEIIISATTQKLLPKDTFDLDTSLPPAKVKGKEKPIPIARVLDFASEATMGAQHR
ncbi:MAG: FHA domain-containing protein [Deltaproteobacteria bacterium]|nr:FHA domain-containing protein [Deltaproteobacteria bacterium]